MKQLPKFPVMLRQMWSGQEVQSWIDKNIAPLFVQPSAEPVAWMSWDGDVIDDMTKSAAMRTAGMSSNIAAKYDEPLYLHPPTDSAALRDAAIAELVRRKMTSGNSVPVERCIITAAEIEAIAQQEAP